MDNTCRTCLRVQNNLQPLYNNTEVIHKIEAIASIEIQIDNDLPSQICTECLKNVNRLFNFRKVIINSDKELRERLAILERSRQVVNDLSNSFVADEPSIEYENHSKVIKIESSEVVEDPIRIEEDYHDNNDLGNDLESSTTMEIENSVENKGAENEESFEALTEGLGDIFKVMRTFTCKTCSEEFPSRIKLNTHKRTAHLQKGVCNICGQVIRQDNLKRHVELHNAQPVQCQYCGKSLKNTESLRGHLQAHKGLIFTCEICGKQYKVKTEYKRHVKTHEDPEFRKSECKICGKKVREMRRHILSHTGERPYICQYCHKGFTSPFALKVHIRQHTNEKPYMCRLCTARFPQKVSLVAHIKSKHDGTSIP